MHRHATQPTVVNGVEVTPPAAARLVRLTRPIAGWLSPGAVYLFALIDAIQKRSGITGNLFEIGVHHGKSALVLGAMAQPGDRLGLCDVFGAQALNVSASGRGDREIFSANFRQEFPDDRFLTVYEKLSSELTREEVTPCRFLHVDGGHSSGEALADLELCLTCLVPGGIIAVDDAFHPSWPGVTDAIYRFLARHPEVAPLVVGFNKMLLVEAAYRDRYVGAFEDRKVYRQYIPPRPYSMKVVEVGGYQTYVFHVHSSKSEKSVASWLQRVALEHPQLQTGAARTVWRGVRGIGRTLRLTR